MSTILRSALLAASVAAAMLAAPSQAAQIIGGASGLLGSPNIEQFESGTLGDPAGTTFTNLTFTGGADPASFISSAPSVANLSGQAISNFGTSTENYPREYMEITFGTTITDVAFSFASDDDFSVLLYISAYNGATLVDTLDATALYGAYSGLYYGFTGLAGFDRIVIDSGLPLANYYIDNLQTPATVPEPETLALLGLGLLGLAVTRRRRRA